MLTFYKLFCFLNYPIWVFVLGLRRLKGKEHKERYREKLGYYKYNKPQNEVIWINSLGLGETLSLTFFLKQLSKYYPDKTILLTSSTLHSQIALENIHLSDNIVHQFAPVDNYKALKRFFDHWNPKIALFSELDIWPLRVSEVKKRKTPILLINSRMNEKKKRTRKWLGNSFSETLKAFDHIFLQDESSRSHFIDFGVDEKKITVHGPLKSAGSVFPDCGAAEKKIKKILKGKLIWTAASLHHREEIEILEAYKLAKLKLPNLVLVIVPRAIESSRNTLKKTKMYSDKVTSRTENHHMPDKNTEIIVVGRVGELGLWYKLSFTSFIGNSLNYKEIKTGKNPYEALQAKTTVIHGPKMLEPGYEKLVSLGISDIVFDRHDICQSLVTYSYSASRIQKIKQGSNLLAQNKNMVKSIIEDLDYIYKKRGLRSPLS